MKCRCQRKLLYIPQHLFKPSLHLFGGFVGKGERQNIIGICLMVVDQVRYSVSYGKGFARSRAGNNDQGAFSMKNGLLLLSIKNRLLVSCRIFFLPVFFLIMRRPL